MLSKVTATFRPNWDRYLLVVLFAYRDVPQKSVGLSSNEIIFRCNLRRPLTLLKDMWIRPDIPEYSYLNEIKIRITLGCQIGRENLAIPGESHRACCSLGRKLTTLRVNNEVLIMQPECTNTLLTPWQEPFAIVKCCSPVN